MSNCDDDTMFDQNNGNTNDSGNNFNVVQSLRKVINDTVDQEIPPEIQEAKKRVGNKLLDLLSIQNDINNFRSESITDNVNIIDEDMFTVGKIIGNFLVIDIPPINIKLDLVQLIRNSMLRKCAGPIRIMMKKSIDIFRLEPRVMIMCTEMEMDDLMMEMITYKIPVHTENFRCVYHLAYLGKIDILKAIMANYKFSNIHEIAGRCSQQAIVGNQVEVLKFFCPKNEFECAPDIVFAFFLKAIEYEGHLPIIKYFISGGVNIKQENYRAVEIAKKFNRGELLKYFYEIDTYVVDLLTKDEQEKFGISKLITIDQYIGVETVCNISYDDITENEIYLQCDKKLHHFKNSVWTEWMRNKMVWQCPLCMSPVKRVQYVNKK